MLVGIVSLSRLLVLQVKLHIFSCVALQLQSIIGAVLTLLDVVIVLG